MRSIGGQQAAGVAACQRNDENLFSDENMKHALEMNTETISCRYAKLRMGCIIKLTFGRGSVFG